MQLESSEKMNWKHDKTCIKTEGTSTIKLSKFQKFRDFKVFKALKYIKNWKC